VSHASSHSSSLIRFGEGYELWNETSHYAVPSLPSILPALCCQKVLFFRMNDQVSIKITTDNYTMHTSYCAGSYCFLRFISVGVHKSSPKITSHNNRLCILQRVCNVSNIKTSRPATKDRNPYDHYTHHLKKHTIDTIYQNKKSITSLHREIFIVWPKTLDTQSSGDY
jgi:hypothetical protein